MAKPLLLLIDGYNVLAPVAPPSGRVQDLRWLHRERMTLLARLAEHLPAGICEQTCVVFDAANPPRGRPHRFVQANLEVRFAVGYAEADDLLEEIIRGHHSPKRLTVVSSDHRVQAAARRRKATAFDSERWLDRLLGGTPLLADGVTTLTLKDRQGSESQQMKSLGRLGRDEVDAWLQEFGFDGDGI